MVKVEISEGQFVRSADLKEGIVLQITTEGEIRTLDREGDPAKAKEVLTLGVKIDNEERLWSPNATTLKNLVKSWGDETKNWVNKLVQFQRINMLVFGEVKNVPVGFPVSEPAQTNLPKGSAPTH